MQTVSTLRGARKVLHCLDGGGGRKIRTTCCGPYFNDAGVNVWIFKDWIHVHANIIT